MENGYKIFWTALALMELDETIQYLETNFTTKEINYLLKELNRVTFIISRNPKLFAESEIKKGIRKVTVAKYNTMYYNAINNNIQILSFFSNRQSIDKLIS